MIYKVISKKIVSNLITKQYVDLDDKEIYEYCFEICIATVVSIITLLCIAIVINSVLPSVLFLFSFIMCRMCFGGYHAKTHSKCFLATIINYLFFIIALNTLLQINSFLIFVVLNILSVISVHIFAPVENENNPLSSVHKKKLKQLSYLVAYSIFLLSTILFFIKSIPDLIPYSLLIGLLSAAVAMLIGKLENHCSERRKKNEEKNI